MGEMVNYRLTCDIASRRGSLTWAPLLANKNVVEGEASLRAFSFAVVAGKKRLES